MIFYGDMKCIFEIIFSWTKLTTSDNPIFLDVLFTQF